MSAVICVIVSVVIMCVVSAAAGVLVVVVFLVKVVIAFTYVGVGAGDAVHIASLFVCVVAILCAIVGPIFAGVGGAILGMRVVSLLVIWRDRIFAGVVMWINVGRGDGVERYASVVFFPLLRRRHSLFRHIRSLFCRICSLFHRICCHC